MEVIVFTKSDGPLTKHISLNADGTLHSDGSACLMSSGEARRITLNGLPEFASIISGLRSSQAIGLGRLNPDLPDVVDVTVKARLNDGRFPEIARSREFIGYQKGEPALMLFDYDAKGMPSAVRQRIADIGAFTEVLAVVVPAIKADVGLVGRPSTSAWITRTDTGEALEGSGGRHLYVVAQDGSDIKRALSTAHERAWLQGLGWYIVGAAGQLLDRSVVDRMVYGPERLVFEGAPVLDPPLMQDQERRRPRLRDGGALDTKLAIPSLTATEELTLKRLKADAAAQLAEPCRIARARFVRHHVERLEQQGVMPDTARAAVEKLVAGGVLLPDIELPFDDPALAGTTVRAVLADPDRFIGETLADPMEGVAYGIGKAMVLRRPDGSLIIHSYAHGRALYRLCYDPEGLRDVLEKTPEAEIITTYFRLVHRMAELSDMERIRLRQWFLKRFSIGAREFNKAEREAKAVQAAEDARRREAERQREREAKGDRRPRIPVPATDTPHGEVCATLDAILAASNDIEPPMRDVEGHLTAALSRRSAGLHTLTSSEPEPDAEVLPAPEQVVLTKLDDVEISKHLIEPRIDYIAPKGRRSVRLPEVFVRAYRRDRMSSALPRVTAVATMPLILEDGTTLSGHRLDRERQILFRVPDALDVMLRGINDTSDAATAAAIEFLVNDWLIDVQTDYPGRLKLVALTATVLQRFAFSDGRPGFILSSGQRGDGKSTAVNMCSLAATGSKTPAAAWSFDEEERRKMLLAALGDGLPLLAFDNLPRGTNFGCPHIERWLTTDIYSDRILGKNETRYVPAFTVPCWTVNNGASKGDLGSRLLKVPFESGRLDPENRQFAHLDAFDWTRHNRLKILRAIYTILLGNPRFPHVENPDTSVPVTRFKKWWHSIGAPLERAARCHLTHWQDQPSYRQTAKAGAFRQPALITFGREFKANEEDSETTEAISQVLTLLLSKWPGSFTAADVVNFMNNSYDRTAPVWTAEFIPALNTAANKAPLPNYSANHLAARFRALIGTPAKVNDGSVQALRFVDTTRIGVWIVQPVTQP